MTQLDWVCLNMLQFSFKKKKKESQLNLFTNKFGSLSRRFLNMLMFGAHLVVNESALLAGAILLLWVNFLIFLLLYATYSLYSVFLVTSETQT